MTKNPFLNALSAVIYICAVAMFVFHLPKGVDNTVFAPIAMLSLLTFSAAFMAFTFFYQPVQLYLDGKKKVAVDLFLKTFLTFGGFTTLLLALLFFGVLR